MRNDSLWQEIRAGGHGVAALEADMLQSARLQAAGVGTEQALSEILPRLAYCALVESEPVAVPPMLYAILTRAASRQNEVPKFMQNIRKLGFWDNAGYRATQDAFVRSFGEPPKVSHAWPPMRVLQKMRALWWAFCISTAVMTSGGLLGFHLLMGLGMGGTALSFGAMYWTGRQLAQVNA